MSLFKERELIYAIGLMDRVEDLTNEYTKFTYNEVQPLEEDFVKVKKHLKASLAGKKGYRTLVRGWFSAGGGPGGLRGDVLEARVNCYLGRKF